MRKHFILIVITLIIISLTGLIFTQIFWLNKSVNIAMGQFDDRADRMLHDVVNELEEFADTSTIVNKKALSELNLFDVVDTALLENLVSKYVNYHRLDSNYHYALVRSHDDMVLFPAKQFTPEMETDAYKACLSCIWKKEYIHLSVAFPEKTRNIYHNMLSWILLSAVFLLIIISIFSFIIYSLIRQKKISEIKNDFINNMTHEFKTPISTISLASEMLMKDYKKPSSERLLKYSRIIYDENRRMQSQVELVLQTAISDRKKIKLKKEDKNIHELIMATLESFAINKVEKEVKFHFNLLAKHPILSLDATHIRNVISNIIDNGIKYSNGKPDITIETQDRNKGVLIEIVDKGIGMTRDAQKRIFEKFYRVSTGDVHDVKGFGLGLYYVKSIVEAHQGSVYVRSALNKGSSFYVFLPNQT